MGAWNDRQPTRGAGLAIGIGTALGVSVGKLAIGVAIGVALGLGLGATSRGGCPASTEVDDDTPI